MLKPVRFVKACNVNGPLYQAGDIAGFMPELVAQLVADGSARELHAGESPAQVPAAEPVKEALGTFSGFPQAAAEERQAARSGKKSAEKPGGKK